MDDDVFESLKNFICETEPIPWGGGLPGNANHMYGLRGDNHPALIWLNSLSDSDREQHFSRIRQGIKRNWDFDMERKKSHSESMKEKWVSGKLNADTARKNGNHGLKGKEVHNTLVIEYKGKTYYGWRELHEGTGVTKHLYNKYYLTGIDPESRIGTNGPAKVSP
jgi:hypothetical protein